MNTLYELPRPLIFAHRGASALAPENTLAAFQKALDLGASAIELDVQLTRDGKLIVIHDGTVDRTTGSSGKVSQMTLQALQELDAGTVFSEDFRGEKLPSLADVFDAFGKKLFINIELKNYERPTDALPFKAADLVREHGLQDWVMFSSFNPLSLIRTRRVLPTVPVGMLAEGGSAGGWARGWIGRRVSPKLIHPCLQDATQEFIAHQHDLGRRVNVWTVNSEQDMERLASYGVDGIFTDDPAKALRLMKPY